MGTYQITVDSVSFTFAVPAAGSPIGLIIGICLGALVLIVLLLLLIIKIRRNKSDYVRNDYSPRSSHPDVKTATLKDYEKESITAKEKTSVAHPRNNEYNKSTFIEENLKTKDSEILDELDKQMKPIYN